MLILALLLAATALAVGCLVAFIACAAGDYRCHHRSKLLQRLS